MRKTISILFAVTALLFLFSSCTGKPLPDGFVREEVIADATQTVKLLSDKKYDEVCETFSDQMKIALDADKLKEAFDSQLTSLGAFKEVTSSSTAGGEEASIGAFATVVLVCKYDNGSAVFTISIDKENRICGLYMK